MHIRRRRQLRESSWTEITNRANQIKTLEEWFYGHFGKMEKMINHKSQLVEDRSTLQISKGNIIFSKVKYLNKRTFKKQFLFLVGHVL